jgi:hypothetical protein
MALLEHLEKMAIHGKVVPPLYLEVRKLFTQHLSEFRSASIAAPTRTIPTTNMDMHEHEDSLTEMSRPEHERAPRVFSHRKAING